MKLYYTPTSPYVRKVLVTAHELGLADRIETELLRPSPMSPSEVLSARNPLSKIPALVLDDDTTLYDSPVIGEYLASLVDDATAERFLPARGPARWTALRRQALADGVLDAGILVFYERTQRPAELHWEAWISGQTKKVLQGLDAMEREVGELGDGFGVGEVAAACALGWLTFRDVVGDWQSSRPRLASWFATVSERPSMRATVPRA